MLLLSQNLGDSSPLSGMEGMRLLAKYINSIGRYGNTPFIVSLYGSSEFPQAFCRFDIIHSYDWNIEDYVLSMGDYIF